MILSIITIIVISLFLAECIKDIKDDRKDTRGWVLAFICVVLIIKTFLSIVI